MLRIHEVFDLPEGSIRTRFVESSRATNSAIEQQIEREWRETLARPGVKLFDGPMCRMESWELAGDSLTLNLSRTSYRIFVGTNIALANRPDDSIPNAMLARPIGVSPALLSSDGFLLLGRRNGWVAYYPHRLHPFAGAIEARENVDVFAEVRRELHEELSFDADDIAGIRCTGIVEDTALRHPEMIFAVRSTRTKSQIESQVDADEHHASWACRATAENVEAALKSEKDFTPVARAAMLLFGRIEFGDHWFSRLSTDH